MHCLSSEMRMIRMSDAFLFFREAFEVKTGAAIFRVMSTFFFDNRLT